MAGWSGKKIGKAVSRILSWVIIPLRRLVTKSLEQPTLGSNARKNASQLGLASDRVYNAISYLMSEQLALNFSNLTV